MIIFDYMLFDVLKIVMQINLNECYMIVKKLHIFQ